MKKVFAFVLLALFGLGFASLSISGLALSKAALKPGESAVINMTISNADDTEVVEGVAITIDGNPAFTYTSSISVGDLNPSTSTSISIPVKANADAASGIYAFAIKAQGFTKSATQSNLNYKGASIAIPVLRKPVITISDYEPTYSENSELRFTINNYGGSAKNARLAVVAPFALYGESELFLGDISGSMNVSLNLNVAGVDEGQNTLKLLLIYEDELGSEANETKNVSLNVKKELIDLSFTQLSEIFAKRDSTATFRVSNSGKDLRDVRITFTDANITVRGGNDIKLGDLRSGESMEFSFSAYMDLSPGTKNVDAEITYVEDGKEKTKETEITFTIGSDSDVQVFVEGKPIPLSRGEEHTLSVTVANTWEYPIESTSVRAEGNFFSMVSVQNEQYIGLLSKDDFSSVQFKIRIDDDAPAEGNLTVYVKYREPSGNWIEQKKVIAIPVGEKAVAQDSGATYLAAGAVAAAACAYWVFFRKRKKV